MKSIKIRKVMKVIKITLVLFVLTFIMATSTMQRMGMTYDTTFGETK